MTPIEEVYEGINRKKCNDVEFILCSTSGNPDDENVESHIEGSGITDMKFVLPAVKVGAIPNDDGFYPVSILTCCYTNGHLIIYTFSECVDDEKIVFFDVKNIRLLDFYKRTGKSLILSETQEYVIGSVTNDKYFYHTLWEFTIDQKNTEIH